MFDDQPIYFRWIGDHPKEEWTKFGYRLEMKIKFWKIHVWFMVTSMNSLSNISIIIGFF